MADPRVKLRLRPIIRVFVSSTFSDLKLERDALQQRVFPKLERLCQKDGFQFQAIDLRWGVPTEAGLHHRTMRICFEELRRSQEVSPEPNFLILLGSRYGWRPLPEEISADEFQRLEDAARQIDIVDGQQQPVDVLRQWYLLDENALTPVYILQPRRKPSDDDPGSTDYTTLEAWRPVEQTLWRIVNRAFPPAGLRSRFQFPRPNAETPPSIVRFQTSATEQEIWAGALSVPNAERHVRAFFRHITNRDEFSPIEVKDFFDVTEAQEFDDDGKTAQAGLKEAIKSRLGNNAVLPIPFSHLKRQEGRVVIDASEEGIQRFCDDVERTLTEVIQRQIQEYWEPNAPAAVDNESLRDRRTARELEIERDEHLRFGKERGSSDFFIGRDEKDGPLARIRDYLDNDSRFPLVIHGESGCGKTALLARSFEEIPEEKQPIIRFLGVTPRSCDLRSLLRSLCQELRGRNAIAKELSTDIQELTQEFRQHLDAATVERPVILFLDALDQLSDVDNGRQLFWLPCSELPAHAKIIVSCLSDRDEDDLLGQPYRSLEGRGLPAVSLDALSSGDARILIFDRWLNATGRKVNEAQRRLIETRLDLGANYRQPFYLTLLFEEVKRWRSWDTPAEPGHRVSELLHQLCQRLSSPENHGASLVRFVLGYIGAARWGLSETEILEVLFADPDYREELDRASEEKNHTLPTVPPRIPIAIWSRLRYDLAPYLADRSAPGANVLAFYHRQVADWVKDQVVGKGDWNPHERLVDYFRAAADPRSDGSWRDGLTRSLVELPFQLCLSGQSDDATKLFCDLRYLDARVACANVFDLVHDFRLVADLDNDHTLEFRNFTLCHAQKLTRHRGTFFSLAYFDGTSAIAKQARSLINSSLWTKPWMRVTNLGVPLAPEGVQVAIELQVLTRFERSCATELAPEAHLAFYVKRLGEVGIIDIDSGEEFPYVVNVRRSRPEVIASTSDGRLLAVAFDDGQGEVIRIDFTEEGHPQTQRVLTNFAYRRPEIEAPVLAWDGNTLVFQSADLIISKISVDQDHARTSQITLPQNSAGELSGVVTIQGDLTLMLRQNDGATAVLRYNRDQPAPLRWPNADVTSVCVAGNHLAVGFTNRHFAIYDVASLTTPVASVTLEHPVACSAKGQAKWICLTEDGEIYAWTPTSGAPRRIGNKTQLFGQHRMVQARRLVASEDNTFAAVAESEAFRFSIGSESSRLPYPVRTVLYGPGEDHYAIQERPTRNMEQWLINLDTEHQVQIISQQQNSLRCSYGVDGTGWMLAVSPLGGGKLANLQTNEFRDHLGIPPAIIGIDGDPDSGFWLANRSGRIFYATLEDCTEHETLKLRAPGQAQLRCKHDLLVWYGTAQHFSGVGEDSVHTIVLWERGPNGRLAAIGTRHFLKSDGQMRAFDYDAYGRQLIVVFERSERFPHSLLIGSPADFVAGCERSVQLVGVDAGVTAVRCARGSKEIDLLCVEGALFRVDMKTLELRATLSLSERITAMANGFGNESDLILVLNGNQPVLCKYEEPR